MNSWRRNRSADQSLVDRDLPYCVPAGAADDIPAVVAVEIALQSFRSALRIGEPKYRIADCRSSKCLRQSVDGGFFVTNTRAKLKRRVGLITRAILTCLIALISD
jgi:hypothetical protein